MENVRRNRERENEKEEKGGSVGEGKRRKIQGKRQRNRNTLAYPYTFNICTFFYIFSVEIQYIRNKSHKQEISCLFFNNSCNSKAIWFKADFPV